MSVDEKELDTQETIATWKCMRNCDAGVIGTAPSTGLFADR